jgi:hypothetical protein
MDTNNEKNIEYNTMQVKGKCKKFVTLEHIAWNVT